MRPGGGFWLNNATGNATSTNWLSPEHRDLLAVVDRSYLQAAGADQAALPSERLFSIINGISYPELLFNTTSNTSSPLAFEQERLMRSLADTIVPAVHAISQAREAAGRMRQLIDNAAPMLADTAPEAGAYGKAQYNLTNATSEVLPLSQLRAYVHELQIGRASCRERV